jgi:hypothetical protein
MYWIIQTVYPDKTASFGPNAKFKESYCWG